MEFAIIFAGLGGLLIGFRIGLAYSVRKIERMTWKPHHRSHFNPSV